MGFTHTRAMTTLVVATFAVLILTGCSGGESESGKAPWRGNTADGPAGAPTIRVLPPGSLAPGMEMKELPEFPESSGMSDERVEQAVDTMVRGDVGAVERLSLQQYMGTAGRIPTQTRSSKISGADPTSTTGGAEDRDKPADGTPQPCPPVSLIPANQVVNTAPLNRDYRAPRSPVCPSPPTAAPGSTAA